MAAGLGFKDFVTGEVLTAADVDGYLMQGVWVFASAAARDAAVTSPQEGNFAYLKDTNVTTYYTGSAWANLDTTGMTNPMTTTGDTIYSSSGSTPARLGIGSTGNVLTVSGGLPVWAAPAGGGGLTLLSTTSCSGTSTTVSSISQSYKQLFIEIYGVTWDTGESAFTFNTNLTSALAWVAINPGSSPAFNAVATAVSPINDNAQNAKRTGGNNYYNLLISNYASTTNYKTFDLRGCYEGNDSGNPNRIINFAGGINSNTAINSFTWGTSSALNMTAGTIKVYGVN